MTGLTVDDDEQLQKLLAAQSKQALQVILGLRYPGVPREEAIELYVREMLSMPSSRIAVCARSTTNGEIVGLVSALPSDPATGCILGGMATHPGLAGGRADVARQAMQALFRAARANEFRTIVAVAPTEDQAAACSEAAEALGLPDPHESVISFIDWCPTNVLKVALNEPASAQQGRRP